MAENNEEKLIAVARQIAKTLGHTDNAVTDDILQIFSNFDGRFKEKLTGSLSGNDAVAALDQTLKTLDRRVSRYLTVDEPIWSNSGDASLFLAVVDELIAVIRDGSVMDDDMTSGLDRAEDLLRQCMFRLEEEFKRLIEHGGVESDGGGGGGGGYLDSDSDSASDSGDVFHDVDVPVAHPVTDYNITIEALSSGTINDLHRISQRMINSGYGKECSLAYSTCRRDFIAESLSRLGFLGLQNSNKPLVDDDNDIEIEKWIKAINMAVRVIYPSEQRLCDRVFGYSSATAAAAADLSFMDTVRVSAMELLNFANNIAMGSRTPERLFKILDVYEAVKGLLPEFEVLFSGHYCVILKNEAVGVWRRLGESIRGIFVELENLIRRDPVKAAVPGGGLHPITRYVMNYLRAACSRPTLKRVFDDDLDQNLDQSSTSGSGSLSVQIAWIMEVLESNLESKSKAYRDPALSSVFMMNNERYIIKKVKDDELGLLLGDDWIRRQKSKVRQHHVTYQRSSWHKILNTLKLDNHNSSSSSNLASKSLKDKIKIFNSQFMEICRSQSTWVVFDEQLREELKISVAGTLLPAYRNFLGRFHGLQDVGKYGDKHVKFTIEDVEGRIDGLFQATAVAGSGRR